ncbi:MAG: ABC transporter permease [Muribaculaceae bacterium]|nr:ABC transporter permease [Muribaculaceae bacterium]
MKSYTNTLVRRLMRHNVSTPQIAGYALASLVGLAIVLAAMQFYRDASGLFAGGDSGIMRHDYLVLSKQVAIGSGATAFTADEIADLESQPWAEAAGAFTASRFKASLGVDFAGRGMSTETFFESIPDEFFDTLPSDWSFDPSEGEMADVPIVVSRDYLALYNFGFAATRGLPTLREGEIGMIPLRLYLRGSDGSTLRMRAHIAGFSSRINTIAVPQQFMDWANARLAPGSAAAGPSRLVVKTNTPGDPAIAAYMRRHSLDIAGDKIDNGTAAYFLRVATGAVAAIGAIISALAFFVLMLSIFLLLQKNRDKLHQLMLLGYSPSQAARPYVMLIAAVNTAVLIAAIIAVAAAQLLWKPMLEAVGAPTASLWPTVCAGVALMAAVSAINIACVRRIINKDF